MKQGDKSFKSQDKIETVVIKAKGFSLLGCRKSLLLD